uniref:F-box domain-containing protein n=1 Tax=Oryza nivara TaxID=4536 RepID=A0A0E0IP80_ORYNI
MGEDSVARHRPHSCSPETSPPPPPRSPADDDDLLSEILLRLPPQPSSLLRASLRRLVAGPVFLRRFRAHHHRSPPLLGFFIDDYGDALFTPTFDPPNRITAERLSLRQGPGERLSFLGCRHALALLLNRPRLEALVWDPVTGRRRAVAFPPEFAINQGDFVRGGAVLCAAAAADDGHVHVHGNCPFKLALVFIDNGRTQISVCLYDSESGTWGDIASTTLVTQWTSSVGTSTMVGNVLCWLIHRPICILEFNLDKQIMSVIGGLAHVPDNSRPSSSFMFPMEDSKLGIGILSGQRIRLWERMANSEWLLRRTLELEKILSLKPQAEPWRPVVLGFAEESNAVFVLTAIGVFMIQLDSLQFRNLFESNFVTSFYPYTSFYTADLYCCGGKRSGGTKEGRKAILDAAHIYAVAWYHV